MLINYYNCILILIRCLIGLLLPLYHVDDKWMVTIFGAVVPSSEVNEQLTDDDLLSVIHGKSSDCTERQYYYCSCELDAYLADCNANNCMQFWQENVNKFPKLNELHLKHQCIPTASAAMERCFSAAGYIVNARRSRLTHQMLEDMLIAKSKKDFMDK